MKVLPDWQSIHSISHCSLREIRKAYPFKGVGVFLENQPVAEVGFSRTKSRGLNDFYHNNVRVVNDQIIPATSVSFTSLSEAMSI